MQNIEMAEIKKQIHCKLTYNDQIRRFIFNGTEFAELRGHISHLLSLPPDGFVLKYVDNESDLITLSSNEDLILALDLSDKILRLVVENPTVPPMLSTTASPASACSSTTLSSPPSAPLVDPGLRGFPDHHGHGGGWGRGHHGHHGGPHHGGPHHHPHPWHHGGGGGMNWDEKREKNKERIQSKIDFFKKSLDQIPSDDWKRQGLLMKINRLENRLLRWDAMGEKKMCKKNKHHKNEKKWANQKLSPEALIQVQTLKSQVATLKPVLYQLKVTKKAKKSELELALQTGQGDKESIWSEILRLKESIHETQKQISSFKDQIHAIRG